MKFCTFANDRHENLKNVALQQLFIFGDDIADVIDINVTREAWLKNLANARCCITSVSGNQIVAAKMSGIVDGKQYLAMTPNPEYRQVTTPQINGQFLGTGSVSLNSIQLLRKVGSVSQETDGNVFLNDLTCAFRDRSDKATKYFVSLDGFRHYLPDKFGYLVPDNVDTSAVFVTNTFNSTYNRTRTEVSGGSIYTISEVSTHSTANYGMESLSGVIGGSISGTDGSGEKSLGNILSKNSITFGIAGNFYARYISSPNGTYSVGRYSYAPSGTESPSLPYLKTAKASSAASKLKYACLPLYEAFRNRLVFYKYIMGTDLIPDKETYLPNEIPLLTLANQNAVSSNQVISM